MTRPRHANSHGFERANESVHQVPQPHLDDDEVSSRAVEAWFLGSKGENAQLLEDLVVEAVRDQAFWRRNFHPDDPTHITEAIKQSPSYLAAKGKLKESYVELLALLKKSVPFFSMRYQGHMNWDLTLPGMLGYFAAMLYNPNNVAFEGSTATTILELIVGDDICEMLGYDPRVESGVRPWGHITCDGTVANIEAIWSARNLKFYSLAIREALRVDPTLSSARNLVVDHPAVGRRPLLDLTPWQLVNLDGDKVLELPARFDDEFGVSKDVFDRAIEKFSLQNLGLADFSARFLRGMKAPVFLVPGTKHYSFPKAAALLGLGADNMIDVEVDLDARLSIESQRAILEECLESNRPVIASVAVIGSTEESAIDPIAGVLALRDEFSKRGLNFAVHADAAWGGYHRSVMNPDRAMPTLEMSTPPVKARLSRYVERQFQSLGQADSITVDPHKSGYIPYPAGALCYRNGAMRNLVTFSAPVVFHGEAEPTVGIYGIEGSKPGAAAASVYLSHKTIRPSQGGYGEIISRALYSCRKLYARLLTMAEDNRLFTVVPIPRLPAERRGGTPAEIAAELGQVRTLIDEQDADFIRSSPAAMDLLREIGPDQNILAYAFNFKLPDGTINPDLGAANALNKAIYDLLSINPGEDIYGYDLIVSTTDLDVATYGTEMIDDYKVRLGVGTSPGGVLTVLRSVIMDPWVTETSKGSFIDVLEREFRKAVGRAMESVAPASSWGC